MALWKTRFKVKRWLLILNICIPLLIGLTFYYCFRPDTLFCRIIYYLFGHEAHYMPDTNNIVLLFIRNYLCDLLWGYSLAMSLMVLHSIYNTNLLYLCSMCALADIAMESLQLITSVGGTFDYFDILMQLLGSLLAVIIYLVFIRKADSK